MVSTFTSGVRLDWRLILAGAAGAFTIFLALDLYSIDFGVIVYSFLIVPIVALLMVVLVFKAKGRRVSVAATLVTFLAVSAYLLPHWLEIRTESRWLINSKSYQDEVLAQPTPSDGQLKHAEWDGWGGFGTGDTTVYLVFDPTEELDAALRHDSSGKFPGIPCEIYRLHRLSAHWYTAHFYTDTDWTHCQ